MEITNIQWHGEATKQVIVSLIIHAAAPIKLLIIFILRDTYWGISLKTTEEKAGDH